MLRTLKSDAIQPRERNCDVIQENSTAQTHVGFAYPTKKVALFSIKLRHQVG